MSEKAAPPNRRVLHVVDSLGPGGAQAILKGYFEYRADDRAIHLYGLRVVPSQMKIAHGNVMVYRSSKRFSFAPLRELYRIVRLENVTVLHCHLFRSQVFGFILKSLFFPRIVLVFHEHGRVVGREAESGLEALLFRLFLRLARRRVDRFICISDYTRRKLLQVVSAAADRATVIVDPIPVHPCGAAPTDPVQIRRSIGVPEGAFVVGFAGRLVETKGWRQFLEAVRMVSRRTPVFFLMAGDGQDRKKVEACIDELGLAGLGKMLGHIEWMDRFYRSLDCFAMPSHWESHGLSQLEAQGFGVPVVVSCVPGLKDTVHPEEDALMFPAGDAQALADCIQRIAGDPTLRDRLATAGIVNASQYTMESFSRAVEEVYAVLLQAKAGGQWVSA